MARESLDDRIYNTLEELSILLSFMVDCRKCPLEFTCKRTREQYKTDLCELLLGGDV